MISQPQKGFQLTKLACAQCYDDEMFAKIAKFRNHNNVYKILLYYIFHCQLEVVESIFLFGIFTKIFIDLLIIKNVPVFYIFLR